MTNYDTTEPEGRLVRRLEALDPARYGSSTTGRWGSGRQPIHTVYGGAHLFKHSVCQRLGELALRHLDSWSIGAPELERIIGSDSELAERVLDRVLHKLKSEPVEDYRVDFEDGFGVRSDSEEDGEAIRTAAEMAAGLEAGTLPPRIGIRIKVLGPVTGKRALRTLRLFVSELLNSAGQLPPNFVVTLPKVETIEQVEIAVDALSELEERAGLDPTALELMVESPRALIDAEGRSPLATWLTAGQSRIQAIHFGPYDYMSSLGIAADDQALDHPACDTARRLLQLNLAGSGVWLADGPSNEVPAPAPSGDNEVRSEAERDRVLKVMARHSTLVRRSLSAGIYQGWDIHPSQLPTRFATVYAFYLQGLDGVVLRLVRFKEAAAQATMTKGVFDDAATGRGLFNFIHGALGCGAVTENELLAMTGLSREELAEGSLAAMRGAV